MNRRLRLILALVWTAGAAIVWQAGQVLLRDTPSALKAGAVPFMFLLVLAIIAEMKPVPHSLGGGRASKDESMNMTLILLTLLAFGWPAAVLLAAVSVVVADISANKPYYKILFNGSMYAIATAAGAIVYGFALGQLEASTGLSPMWTRALAGLVAGTSHYVANLTLLMFVLSVAQGFRLRQMLVWGLRDSAMVNFVLISIGIAMFLLWERHPAAAAVLVPAIVMAKSGYQGYTRLRSEAESMLGALADAIDLRDDDTGQHSLRVAEMSHGVARALRLPEEQALAIKAIARVHDVGKIVIRDAVLLKAGALSSGEKFHMQSHVQAGAQILSHLSVYKPHLPFLLQHHERMDGRGYPLGLESNDIELGARILAVCDAYDTLTSDRPYRAAVSREDALVELYRSAGSQFDPDVVKALEAWLIMGQKLRGDWRRLPGADSLDDAGVASRRRIGAPGAAGGNGYRPAGVLEEDAG
jgi:HD-GYP domain-containing protein (c-di-GMP phosphodiesterase class II)